MELMVIFVPLKVVASTELPFTLFVEIVLAAKEETKILEKANTDGV
jgi:hypothetical protein